MRSEMMPNYSTYNKNLIFEELEGLFIVDPNNFLGFRMQQCWTAIYALNEFFNRNQNIKRIVELGTGSGGLTIFWGLIMKAFGGKVLTFDLGIPSMRWFKFIKDLPIEFEVNNVFSEDVKEKVKEFIKDDPSLIFCDNGNKPQEFLVYHQFLKPGDFIMAHDWKAQKDEPIIEICEADVKDLLDKVEYYQQDLFDKNKSRILSMKRRA